MVTSVKNLKSEIDSRLAGGGLTALECCQLDNAKGILANNIVYKVANSASLPNVTLNEGRFVYLDDVNEYRYSNGLQWTDNVCTTITVFSNQLWAWGSNGGQLGDGTITSMCSPVREFCSATDWCSASAGQISAAIKTSGQLWTWGQGSCGQLGDGTAGTNRCSPVREFCSATDWCQVSAGACHSAAIKTSGQIWAWGLNTCGRLGDGTTVVKCSPVRERCSATDWCGVSAGRYMTAAVKTTGQIWAWGSSRYGRLGDGTTVDKCSPVREFCSATDWCRVSAGISHTAAVKTSGQLWAWGNNVCGRLGDGTTVDKCSPVREFCSATDWCQLSAGNPFTIAIKTSGQLWSWGINNHGQLGDGTLAEKCSPVREFCSATDWCGVGTGACHTAAVKTSGQLWAWGLNNCGQLGEGTANTRCSPVREFCSATDWCLVRAGFGSQTVAIKAITKGFLE